MEPAGSCSDASFRLSDCQAYDKLGFDAGLTVLPDQSEVRTQASAAAPCTFEDRALHLWMSNGSVLAWPVRKVIFLIVASKQTMSQPIEESLAQRVQAILVDLKDEYLDPSHNWPWIIGYSGGKDSTVVVQFVLEMLLDLSPGDRKREVHILSNDTMVESPLIATYVDNMLDRMSVAMRSLALPVKVAKCTPSLEQTFWVNLIGRGYPSPNRQFRWCTDRMKIQPTNNYILQKAAENGQVILLLGVRRDESSTRSQSINRHDPKEGRLNPHSSLQGCFVYRPIVNVKTDEIWDILLQRRPPWGGSHRELITLYRNAQGGECPMVLSKEDAPSCGSSSSRFGCWTCTVVEKDRSMAGFIDAGFENLEPLMDFRDYLYRIRNDLTYRQDIRRNGNPGLGPFTMAARKEILEELLKVQEEAGTQLISEAEIARIREIWFQDEVTAGQRTLMAYFDDLDNSDVTDT